VLDEPGGHDQVSQEVPEKERALLLENHGTRESQRLGPIAAGKTSNMAGPEPCLSECRATRAEWLSMFKARDQRNPPPLQTSYEPCQGTTSVVPKTAELIVGALAPAAF
jgi:hypothetical protein